MGTMGQTLLHLVDRRGETLPVAIRLAVEAAHRWVRGELERWAGIDRSTQRVTYRTVLFDQLKTKLSDRDRHILVLLQQDITSPASVAAALGVSYAAGAKAIQRVKERISTILVGDPTGEQAQMSPHICESESGG